MRICSITLASDNYGCDKIVGDAFRSVVNEVDICLLIHLVETPKTHPTGSVIDVARDVAGDKLTVVDFHISQMEEWRNFGLLQAELLGMDWAVQLDTDERMMWNGVDIRRTLENTPPEVTHFTIEKNSGIVDRPRIFRLPADGRYKKAVHEEFISTTQPQILPVVRFWELDKTLERVMSSVQEQIDGLTKAILDDPENPRWHYYLGSILDTAGRTEEAIAALERSLPLHTNSIFLGWTYYRGAMCFHRIKRRDDCLRWCACGMMSNPTMAELPWMAGVESLLMGAPRNAIAWAQIARVHSWIGQSEAMVGRVGFKEPVALFEGPYAVMSEAYRVMGFDDLSRHALDRAEDAKQKRFDFFERGIS